MSGIRFTVYMQGKLNNSSNEHSNAGMIGVQADCEHLDVCFLFNSQELWIFSKIFHCCHHWCSVEVYYSTFRNSQFNFWPSVKTVSHEYICCYFVKNWLACIIETDCNRLMYRNFFNNLRSVKSVNDPDWGFERLAQGFVTRCPK